MEITKNLVRRCWYRDFYGIQQFRVCTSTTGVAGLIPGWGTKILKLLVLLRTYLSGYPKAILRGQDRAAGQQKQEGGLWGCSAALQEGFILLAHCTLARLICSPRWGVQSTLQFEKDNKMDCNGPVLFFQPHPVGFRHKWLRNPNSKLA